MDRVVGRARVRRWRERSLAKTARAASVRPVNGAGATTAEMLAALVAETRDYAIFTLDLDGRVASWNAGAERFKGYTAAEIIGRHFSVFYSPEDITAGKPQRELTIAAAEGRLEDEGWRVRHDGSRFWAHVVITPLRGPDGVLRGYGKVTRDLTERRALELAVRSRDERFRLMVESVEDYAILMLDPEGVVATWNPGVWRLKGYPAEDIVGRHFSVFYPPEDIAAGKPQRELEAATLNGKVEDEGWRVRGDGSRFWASVVITALRAPDGGLRGFSKVTRDLSERHAREQALRERDRLVSDVLDAATGCAIISTDLDGTITLFNPGAERMLGHRAAEVIGQRTPAMFHDPDEIAMRAEQLGIVAGFDVVVNAARRGESELRVWTYVRRDGTRLPVEVTVSPVFDGDRRIRGFIGVAVDLTERRQADEALRLAEQRFRRSFQDAPRGMAMTDAGGLQLLDANDALCQMLGYERAELLQLGVAAITHPDDLEENVELCRRMLSDEIDRAQVDQRYLHRDGHVVDASIGFSLIRDGLGQPRHFVTQVDDITDRKRAELELRRVEARVRQLLEAAPDAMITVDEDGIIQSANVQSERLFGYSNDELVGCAVDLLVPGAARAGHSAKRASYATAPTTRPMGVERELHALHKNGSEVPVSITLSSVPTEDGLFVTAAIRDVTERRREQELLRAAEEQFRTTIDHAPIGIALVAPDGRCLRVNRALCDMTGYAEGELLAGSFQEITHPDDLDADLEQVRGLLAAEIKSYEIEKRYFRSDGSTMWIMLSVSLVRDVAGEPVHFVSQIQDIGERKRYESDLRDLADHDPLTGLANRRALSHQVNRELAHQERYGASIGFVMIDLDHFKYVNDSLGHRVGDQIIRAVADVLTDRMRETDTVARLGGDEFAILLPHADAYGLEAIAGELVELIATVRINAGEREISCSASIGAVLTSAGGEYDEDTLIAAADLAMYEAKDAGRGRVAIYDKSAGGEGRASARLDWSERIRSALLGDQFVLHYQPIIDLADGSNGRYEALIRLPDADGELVLPGAFLYIAERYGLMPAIDRWVLRAVILSLADGTLPDGAIIALNISARSLTDTSLLELVDELLAQYRVSASQLIFEVTETAAITQLETAKRFGRGLQRLGCGFALDDFGTGFGSFFHLKHLPYGYIKIDGDFVHSMRTNTNDRLLVEAIITVAKGMNKKTIAEFVGDDETTTLLRELGVDYGQGYHLGRPAPMDRPPRIPIAG